MATKSSNPFQSSGWNYLDKLGESSYMPDFYEDDLNNEPMTPSFRSPKIYNQEKTDYFTELNDEIEDDGDALYEATLLNSNFLSSLDQHEIKKVNSTPVNRLKQILNHMNPSYYTKSPLSEALSIRSQFSGSSVIPMVAISMPDPRDTKGKGKFKPNI